MRGQIMGHLVGCTIEFGLNHDTLGIVEGFCLGEYLDKVAL